MVFKNGDVQMGEFKIGEIPIIPLCPGDGTYNCKYTEIYVGYNVTKVDVIVMSNQKKISLEIVVCLMQRIVNFFQFF